MPIYGIWQSHDTLQGSTLDKKGIQLISERVWYIGNSCKLKLAKLLGHKQIVFELNESLRSSTLSLEWNGKIERLQWWQIQSVFNV